MKPQQALVYRSLVFVLALAAVIAQGCSKKTADEGSNTSTGPSVEESQLGDSDSGKAMGLQTVNFALDSFLLDEASKSKIKSNADILKDKKSLRVQIEGHCDIRGGIQYNIALGEKRANAVLKYLVDLGVPADRLTTISYGKERLLDNGSTEAAHARNRRANFVITSH